MISRYKNDRARVLDGYRARNTPQELDVLDRPGGDGLKITSCVKEAAAWWLGTLRAVYPQVNSEDRCIRGRVHGLELSL